MTTEELVDRVVDRSGELRTDTQARTLALGWLNQAQSEVLARGAMMPEGGWWFQRDIEEVALAQGVAEATLGSDVLEVMDASVGAERIPMDHVRWDTYRSLYTRNTGAAGTPEKWTVESRTHPGGLFRLRVWPAPDESMPCHLTVKRQFSDLVDVDGNEPLIPAEFQALLWLRACELRMLHHSGTAEIMPGYKQDYEATLQAMMAAHARHMGRRVAS